MPNAMNFIIVDDHPLYRTGVAQLLHHYFNPCSITEFNSIADFYRGKAVLPTAHMCIVDLLLPDGDGADLVVSIVSKYPGRPVVVLTALNSDQIPDRISERNNIHIVNKQTDPSDLIAKLRQLLQEQPTFQSGKDGALKSYTPLTTRQQEILKLVATGMTDKEIATALSITSVTVRAHLVNIFSKLEVKNRTEAVFVGQQYLQ